MSKFDKLSQDLLHEGYEILVTEEKYTGRNGKYPTRHIPCGNVVNVVPSELLTRGKYKCTHCFSRYKKRSEEQFLADFRESGFEPERVPRTTNERVPVVCERGHRTVKSLHQAMTYSCIVCSGYSKRTNSDLIEGIFESGFEYLEGLEEGSSGSHVVVSCSKGHLLEKTRKSLVDGVLRCPYCSNKRVSGDSVRERLAERGFLLDSDWKGTMADETHTLKHVDCGRFFETKRLSNYLHGCGCPSCDFDARSAWRETLKETAAEFLYLPDNIADNCDIYSSQRFFCKTCGSSKLYKVTSVLYYPHFCSECTEKRHGFNRNKHGIFYYLRVETDSTPVYKIGITNRTVEQRFSLLDLEKITTIRTLDFDKGVDAANLERYYLDLFKNFRYQGPPLLSSGNTELFTYDILALDSQ